ncbi:aminotransferase class V-fold PLP-dependent enzyme [candidate division KSB1 bacterium]|nr:MAG: aminotransferase class V-fold PLP-dependent enzyme [candidate division KSB1 bacterium]
MELLLNLEQHFIPFRQNIIGIDQTFDSPYGEQKILYADWTASGRLYKTIEDKLAWEYGPFVGNTHTETNITGTSMTLAYQMAHQSIKQHCHADPEDVIINAGFGMTAAVNKFQRILGLKIPEQFRDCIDVNVKCRPIVFVTHMEHHSNQTSWEETIAEVIVIPPGRDGHIDLNRLDETVKKYQDRMFKIGAFTAASNVTGIPTSVHDMARIMHSYDGFCFVDYAASAPYVQIDMHPVGDKDAKLDALFFSPHKFLGGPGSSGVLIFDSQLYTNKVPDQPGGGTVLWTNPWHQHHYVSDIETREDGGTPGFLQAIRGALAIKLKEKMGTGNILAREQQMVQRLFSGLRSIPHIHILADNIEQRLGIFSFYVHNIHYNLMVRLLNDRFGIQVRGGCSCAGTYGHYLLHVDPQRSKSMTDKIDQGDLSAKLGWVRLSVHPIMSDDEIEYIIDAVKQIVKQGEKWGGDYRYDPQTNEFIHKHQPVDVAKQIEAWWAL